MSEAFVAYAAVIDDEIVFVARDTFERLKSEGYKWIAQSVPAPDLVSAEMAALSQLTWGIEFARLNHKPYPKIKGVNDGI